jgi:hypothetical protein
MMIKNERDRIEGLILNRMVKATLQQEVAYKSVSDWRIASTVSSECGEAKGFLLMFGK